MRMIEAALAKLFILNLFPTRGSKMRTRLALPLSLAASLGHAMIPAEERATLDAIFASTDGPIGTMVAQGPGWKGPADRSVMMRLGNLGIDEVKTSNSRTGYWLSDLINQSRCP